MNGRMVNNVRVIFMVYRDTLTGGNHLPDCHRLAGLYFGHIQPGVMFVADAQYVESSTVVLKREL